MSLASTEKKQGKARKTRAYNEAGNKRRGAIMNRGKARYTISMRGKSPNGYDKNSYGTLADADNADRPPP